jgi:hypothetical protein
MEYLPAIRPYAIRDNSCRGRGKGGEDEWGSPNHEGFFRDDNSLIKSMPLAYAVNGSSNPYHGKKVRTGFVASHAWRSILGGGTSHANPLTYSFVGNVVWLPRHLAPHTDAEGSLGQTVLKAISWRVFKRYADASRSRLLLQQVWDHLPTPDTSILPAGADDRISYFNVDLKRFAEANHGLIRNLLKAINKIEENGKSSVVEKIRYDRMSLCHRYNEGLPSKWESSDGFSKLKAVLNSTINLIGKV